MICKRNDSRKGICGRCSKRHPEFFFQLNMRNAEFQVMQMNKNNGVQMVGVQVRLQEENVCPVVYVEPFFNEIRLGEPVEKVMNEIARCMERSRQCSVFAQWYQPNGIMIQ